MVTNKIVTNDYSWFLNIGIWISLSFYIAFDPVLCIETYFIMNGDCWPGVPLPFVTCRTLLPALWLVEHVCNHQFWGFPAGFSRQTSQGDPWMTMMMYPPLIVVIQLLTYPIFKPSCFILHKNWIWATSIFTSDSMRKPKLLIHHPMISD